MKLTKIMMVAAILGSFSAKANFNTDCKFAYRTASLDLMEGIEQFRDGKKNGVELGALVGVTDAGVKNFRAACYFTESSENRKCVLAYKEIYSEMREKVGAIALILGNQQKVDFSMLDNAKTKLKIKWNDVKCEF